MTSSSSPAVIAEVQNLDDLRAAFKVRKEMLNISYETLNDLAGLQSGYAQKALMSSNEARASGSRQNNRGIGEMSFAALLGALGLKLIVAEDPEALERVRARLIPRTEAVMKALRARSRNQQAQREAPAA